jgi:hypothetical protein
MHHKTNILNLWRNFVQLLQPFAAHCRLEIGKPGYVAARSGKVLDKAAAYRIRDRYKYQWNGTNFRLKDRRNEIGI